MTFRTNRLVIRLRDMGRVLGINRFLSNLRRGEKYEDRFETSLLENIRRGDCVWDIGANIGHYSAKFSKLVGDAGKVHAFEPSPQNLKVLEENTRELPNVELHPVALGATDRTGHFIQGEDDIGATSRLVDADPGSHEKPVSVRILRGDSLVESVPEMTPNVIKLDVEGAELEVLWGMAGILRQPSLRLVGVEVHFRLLKERNQPNAPREIEQMLTSAGFHCHWPDASHVAAIRVVD